MKLEKIFDCQDGKLIKVDGSAVEEGIVSPFALSWKSVEEGEEGVYNEELLASIRLSLKEMEGSGKYVFIKGEKDRDGEFSQYTAAMKHAARRLKDCTSIAGFWIPEGTKSEDASFFIEELSAKHAQYVFFSASKIEGANTVIA